MPDAINPSTASEDCKAVHDAAAPPHDAPPPDAASPEAEAYPSESSSPDAESPSTPVDPLQQLLDLALTADPHFSARIDPIARDLMRQLAPQDAAEQMLVTQMIASFSRSMFLSRYANRQKTSKWFALFSVECDRAMNLYRRQMQTLADYRRPRRTIFNTIRTANIAGQQVVMTRSKARPSRKKRKPADAQPRPATQAQTALPPVQIRQSRPAHRDPKNPTVDP